MMAPGKIGAVAAECSDTAVGGGADEAGDHGNDRVLREAGAAHPGRAHEFREDRGARRETSSQVRTNSEEVTGTADDAGFFQGRGEEPSAKAFAIGGQTIQQFGMSGNGALDGDVVKQILCERKHFASHPQVIGFGKLQVAQHGKMRSDYAFGFVLGGRGACRFKSGADREQVIGDALHGPRR